MKRGPYVRWSDELDEWLTELVERGLSGFDIASKFSAKLGFPVSADAVYHHANELGLRVGGRSPKSYEITREDPFAAPSWLARELSKLLEVEKRERPVKIVVFGLDEEIDGKIDEAEAEQRTQAAYHELWHDYVSDIVRNGLATDKQAEAALKQVPSWFHKWAQVHIVVMYEPDITLPQKYERSLANGASIDDVKRGLEIEDLLEQGSEIIDTSKDDETVHTEQTDDEDVSLAETSLGDPKKREFVTTSPARQEASRLAQHGSPFEKCQRCSGKPIYDHTLEEWVCSNCGHILRFKP